MRARSFGWLAASAAVLITAACSSSAAPRTCTLIGADDGVVIQFDRGALPASGRVAIRACVDEDCRSHVALAAASVAFVPVLPTPPDAEVDIRVTVLSAKGDTLFAGETTAHTHANQPNGPGCGAPAWQVGVLAHRNNRLTAAP
jgi:hypothetical protein